jgi:hypothetical protein
MKSHADAASGTHVTLSASGDENGDVMARPRADWKPTRYRIDVVGPSIADIFWSVGGWIVDRAMAGCDVIRGDDGSVLEPGQTGELFVRFRDGAGASRRAAVFIMHGTPTGWSPSSRRDLSSRSCGVRRGQPSATWNCPAPSTAST